MYDKLRQQLVHDEGLRLKPYRDTVGKLTIGVGRNLDDVGITEAEALYLLDNDIASHANELFRALPWAEHLDAVRQDVLLNMAFNLGVDGLLKFKLTLALIQGEKWDDAAKAMLQSRWADQVGPRAQRLSKQMSSGVWQ